MKAEFMDMGGSIALQLSAERDEPDQMLLMRLFEEQFHNREVVLTWGVKQQDVVLQRRLLFQVARTLPNSAPAAPAEKPKRKRR